MYALLFVFLLFLEGGHALQCIVNCTISRSFGQTFLIPDGRCQERASLSKCFATMKFDYTNKGYSVQFNKNDYYSYDYIYITSGPYFSYQITYGCKKDTNCPVAYVESRLDGMVARDYNARYIYSLIEPIIGNLPKNASIQCYDLKSNTVTCGPGALCSLEYDTKHKKVKSRGCSTDPYPTTRVFLFDGELAPSLHIECAEAFCNSDLSVAKIKVIFADNGLTDVDGRMIAAGIKEVASSLFVSLAVIFTLFSSL